MTSFFLTLLIGASICGANAFLIHPEKATTYTSPVYNNLSNTPHNYKRPSSSGTSTTSTSTSATQIYLKNNTSKKNDAVLVEKGERPKLDYGKIALMFVNPLNPYSWFLYFFAGITLYGTFNS
mmetsp:Transcript_22310/g.31414  ORF Transcript_22310/g.31414 Transcript_22310/m.31414 type:complete len:123 (+) Transcript_22310:31-399(+)